MPARAGAFGASLRPFGGGELNLDDAYKIEPLTPTPSPPTPGAPPPIEYGGSPVDYAPEPAIPVVGTTPVPPSAVAQPLRPQPWTPAPTPVAAAAPRVTTGEAYAAIRARAIAAGNTDVTFAEIQKTYQNNLARGLTNEQMAR